MSIVKKMTIGSCFFTYYEEYPTEQNALDKVNGKFKEVKIDKLRIERVKVTKLEENDGRSNCQNGTPEVERS
jgi:CBS domain containing-hemolysin-like protein